VKNNRNIVNKRLIRSYITSVISISLVLVLVAGTSIFAANAGSIARYFKENMAVTVMVKQSAAEKEALQLTDKLGKLPFVKQSRFVSKEEGALEMKALLGEDFLDIFEASPIPMSVELHIDGNALTRDSLNVIKSTILKEEIVEEVVYQESLVEALNANLRKISLIVAVVIVILLVISSALISNTVRLNIYARRFTIHTMSLVGAKSSFIAKPFLKQGVIQGIVSGAIAVTVFALLLSYACGSSPLLAEVLDSRINLMVLVGTLLLGVVICVISTLMVVRRVAYISKDDLYY